MAERVFSTAKTPESEQKCSSSCKQKPSFDSSESFADRILQLQRTAGNQAVQKLIKSGTLQAKLKIGQPNDIYEQEADRVADKVMSMPEPMVRRQPEEEEEEEETIQAKPIADQITPLVQRQVEEEEEEPVQTKLLDPEVVFQLQRQPEEEEEEKEELLQTKEISGQNTEIAPDLESRINAIRGGGQPLSESERAFFEPRFGVDFGQVRLHMDTKVAKLARAVNARAFTVGQNVVFGEGQYLPGTSAGKRLLAHELTHVIQQSDESDLRQVVQSVEEESERGGVREDITRVYRDVPCTNWNMLLEAIRELIALRVMSRTLGLGGQPVRREVSLTEDNESLVRTYEAIEAAHREEINQGWDFFEDITAVFHYVNDRVESITFRPPQSESEGERGPDHRTLTVRFSVGGLTSQQLTSQDPEVLRDVFLRFERQLVLHVAMMDSINVPDDFYDQIDRHMSELSAPEDVPLLVQTTVQVTPRESGEHWPCRVIGMTAQISTFVGNEPPQAGPDPEQALREMGGREAWYTAVLTLIFDAIPAALELPPIGAIVSEGQMTWALIQFNMEYLYYAYRVGWWHAIKTPQNPRDPERGAFMSSSDTNLPEGHRRRVWIYEHYNHGYDDGHSTRSRLYEEIWRNIYNHRQELGERERTLIEYLDRQENRRSRDEFISACFNSRYPSDSHRRALIQYARGQ